MLPNYAGKRGQSDVDTPRSAEFELELKLLVSIRLLLPSGDQGGGGGLLGWEAFRSGDVDRASSIHPSIHQAGGIRVRPVRAFIRADRGGACWMLMASPHDQMVQPRGGRSTLTPCCWPETPPAGHWSWSGDVCVWWTGDRWLLLRAWAWWWRWPPTTWLPRPSPDRGGGRPECKGFFNV
jgi:hypothetical protein